MRISPSTDDPLPRWILVAWGLMVSFRLVALPLSLASSIGARRYGLPSSRRGAPGERLRLHPGHPRL
ncbi:hypothetical protein [Aquisphaera insulae]|uniref:hypothetical protein n=1 Tax=Aquisphaera insulae TaxID=2712864 RepID=UPI0013E9B8C7|nr:hypothetical protein [Aquisphaera insulae]